MLSASSGLRFGLFMPAILMKVTPPFGVPSALKSCIPCSPTTLDVSLAKEASLNDEL